MDTKAMSKVRTITRTKAMPKWARYTFNYAGATWATDLEPEWNGSRWGISITPMKCEKLRDLTPVEYKSLRRIVSAKRRGGK